MQLEINAERLKQLKVWILVPAAGDKIHATFAACLIKLLGQLRIHGIWYELRFLPGDSLVTRARNNLADIFMADSTDPENHYSLWLDCDVLFGPESVIQMLALNMDFLAAPYTRKGLHEDRIAEAARLNWPNGRMMSVSGSPNVNWVANPVKIDEPFPVLEAGSGFWLVKRKVFEQLRDSGAAPRYKRVPDEKNHYGRDYAHDYFRVGVWPETEEYLSEDWWFPVSGDTRVLKSDYSWTPMGNVCVGDKLLSVDEHSPKNSSRRYRETTVLNKIYRSLPAWRIVTGEGDLVTTAEHPWLVDRSWRRPVGHHKHDKPIGPPNCWTWTPTSEIRAGDYIARVTPQSKNPDEEQSFRHGYLQGIMQGDGHLYSGANGGMLRMCDLEALHRFQRYLEVEGIAHTPCKPQSAPKSLKHRQQYGVYIKSANIDTMRAIRNFEAIPSGEFAAGYLSGIFDAEGHFDGATIDISNNNALIRNRVVRCGSALGFDFKDFEKRCVTRLNGIEEVQRFWMETQPAIRRKMSLNGQSGAREAMHKKVKVLSVEPLGHVDDVQCVVTDTGTFVAEGFASHNCREWRNLGGTLYCCFWIQTSHIGPYQYPMNMQAIADLLSATGGYINGPSREEKHAEAQVRRAAPVNGSSRTASDLAGAIAALTAH